MARPRKFDEATVLLASRDLFWDQGYASTSVDDLGTATGLGRGSFYNAFGDKHSIFLLSFDLYCAAVLDGVRSELRDTRRRAIDRLVDHLRGYATSVGRDTDRRGCLLAKAAAELSGTDPEVAKRVKRVMDGYLRELTTAVAEARADGDVAADVDAKAMACMLLAVLRGVEAMRKGGASASSVRCAAEQAVLVLTA